MDVGSGGADDLSLAAISLYGQGRLKHWNLNPQA
jgi:hypothetical protein